jgi:methylase of polypeptide subunit release factors
MLYHWHYGHSLEFNWQEHNVQIKKNKGFDLILGNPPYVYLRNMDARTKELIKKWSLLGLDSVIYITPTVVLQH